MKEQRHKGAVESVAIWEPPVPFLRWAVALTLCSSAVYLIVLYIVAPEQVRTARGPAPVVLALVALAAWALLSRGKTRAAAMTLGAGFWAYTTGVALFLGGGNAIIIIAYPVIIMLAGWLLGPRTGIAVAALTAAACFGLLLAQLQGFLPQPPPAAPALVWIAQAAVFAFSALLISFIVTSYRDRLEEVRKLDGDLALHQAEILAREADLNRAQAVAHVGSWVYDLVTDVMHLSAETCRIFGLPEGSTGSRASYLARTHPDDRAAVDSAWQAALKGREPFDYEHRILVGKAIRWVRQRAELELGADGAPLRSMGIVQDVTEHRRAETVLHESEERFRVLFEGAPDAIVLADPATGKILDANRSACRLLGRERDAIVGMHQAELHPPQSDGYSKETFDRHVAESRAQGVTHPIENAVLRPDGVTVPVEVLAQMIRTGDKSVLMGIFRDITERKGAEKALRESEARYHSLFANSSVSMLLVDPADGRIVDANSAACAYYGRDLAELLAMRIGDINILSPDEVRAEMERARNLGRRHFEFRHRLANGKVRDVEVFSGPVKIDGRELRLSVVQDVTEAKKAQQELRRIVAFRELLLEAMPLPVYYKDTSECYVGGNSAFARFIGKSMEDIVGRTVFELSPGRFAQINRDKDLELLHGPAGLQTYESQIAHADGTLHDVILNKARTVDDAGMPTGILGVITDVTEIKRIEAARAHLEAQLRESQKMEALGTLAGGVAHDFNNILAAIMGNAELARQDVGPGHAALESLQEILTASRRAKELVQQILAFGRRQAHERRVMSLAPVVEESVRLLRSTLPAGVGLSVECAPDTPAVLADATQVEQVLLNLCGNAWQAMEGQKRPALIEIRLDAYDHAPGKARSVQAADFGGAPRSGRYACLTVRDTGPGMDPETRARIFEPFFTTKPAGKGTGLGLAVVHSVVQEHGASIDVESVPGEGTTFRICFPGVDASVPAAAAQVPAGAAAQGRGKHILYVDDDEAMVSLMSRLLERQGYRVSAYTDVRAALAAVRAQPETFDLVVTDYNMPGMSGLEAARALREMRADLPVALASGYITDELRAAAPAAGVSELIYKANIVGELCEVVARLVDAPRGRENSA